MLQGICRKRKKEILIFLTISRHIKINCAQAVPKICQKYRKPYELKNQLSTEVTPYNFRFLLFLYANGRSRRFESSIAHLFLITHHASGILEKMCLQLTVIPSFQTFSWGEFWKVVKNQWLLKMTYDKLLYLKWKRSMEIGCKMK